ncbi:MULTISPECIES: DNA primase [unclassified Sphingomonas]|jgi:DNA-directed RNA polymerase subunit delta|uniref:DNA primase n=1 Tax=unclassified Sphingomonas TaxID=196159 RepID=UPI000B29E39F|nr:MULTISPECIES: DNA primase [unclassified Sphingomonas]
MGGYQVPGRGPGDDGFDEEGYDESQRAEILEATTDGPSDGNVLTDIAPDLGDDDGDEDDLRMADDETGEEDDDAGQKARAISEDEAQDDFDADDLDDDEDGDLSDADEDALEP